MTSLWPECNNSNNCEETSVSPFSSSDSSGEDSTGFKAKFQQEKVINRKLNEKLSGYRTIVSQFSKEQNEKVKLKEKIVSLEEELVQKSLLLARQTEEFTVRHPSCVQGTSEVLSELPQHLPQSGGPSSKWTNNSSASFVVIQPFDQGRLEHNPRKATPSASSQTSELNLPSGPSSSTECRVSSQNNKNENIDHQNDFPLGLQEVTSHPKKDQEIYMSTHPKDLSETHLYRNSKMENSMTQHEFNSPETGMSNTFASRTKLQSAEGHGSHRQNDLGTPVLEPPVRAQSDLHTSSKYSSTTITAWAGQGIKSQWQRTQEALDSRASTDLSQQGMTVRPRPKMMSYSTGEQVSQADQNIPAGSCYTQQLPLRSGKLDSLLPQERIPHEQSSRESEVSHPGSNILTEGSHDPLVPIQMWGVGARPKATNVLVEQQLPLIPSQPLQNGGAPLPKGIAGIKWLSSTSQPQDNQKESVASPGEDTCSQQINDASSTGPPLMVEQPGSTSTDLARHVSQNQSRDNKTDPTDAVNEDMAKREIENNDEWENITPEDLMNFPSLKSMSPTEGKASGLGQQQQQKQQQTKDVPTPSSGKSETTPLGQSVEKKVLAFPSDDETQLASQAQSMAVVLSNHTGISDMLYKFADKASRMEEKLHEYQALVQRQQVQMQCQGSHEKEVQQLRKENESLLAYINQMKSRQTGPSETEAGWTILEMPQKAVLEKQTSHELAKRLQSVEDVNGRLFQANREWFTKWEALRQQATDEQGELEAQLKHSRDTVEQLKGDVSTLDAQLQDAVTDRQEEKKKNLELEQEKLNLMMSMESYKSQCENLLRENRQCQAELANIKGSKTKSKDGEKDELSVDELRSMNALFKKQMALYIEDFKKEKDDRIKIQSRADRIRREREALKLELSSRSKKNQALIRTKDEDIQQKCNQVAELQCQVDNLNQQLRREKRRSQGGEVLRAVPVNGHTAPLIYPNASALGVSPSHTSPWVPPHPHHVGTQHQLSPEHLPGAWQCHACTFINFPERTVCDICGWKNLPGNHLVYPESLSEKGELESRGRVKESPMDEPDDVVPDTPITCECKD